MYFEGGYTYSNFLMNMLGIFAFVVWFWLLVIIYGDLFRRHDISGWGKALWVIALVLTSYLGIFAYLITQGRGMAERNAEQAQQARDELRKVVGYSVADEITKLDQLKKSGSINDDEFQAPSHHSREAFDTLNLLRSFHAERFTLCAAAFVTTLFPLAFRATHSATVSAT